MAAEGPSSKKRKVLQPTIKCFMNSRSSAAGEGETSFEGKPVMGRSRSGARTKLSNGLSSDQPPVSIHQQSPCLILFSYQFQDEQLFILDQPFHDFGEKGGGRTERK